MYGYTGKILRLDCDGKTAEIGDLKEETAYGWIGGTGFGVKILTEEVPPHVKWDDPQNKIVLSGGMLTATPGIGSGTVGLVTKGPLTGGVTQSQSNGTLGAFLKQCGYDALVLEQASEQWIYIYIDEGTVKFECADFLLGLDTKETQDVLHKKYGTDRYKMSVYCIGPAAENLVKFAMFTGDYGHVAAHNGNGAVFGAKRVKALCVRRGRRRWPVFNRPALLAAARKMNETSRSSGAGKDTAEFGTLVGYPGGTQAAVLPVKNLTTNLWPKAEEFDPRKIRGTLYQTKRRPCYGCNWTHCVDIRLKDERFQGAGEFEEAEYELAAHFSSGIGSSDIPSALWLSHVVDRVGVDGNEMGWIAAWCIECFERGYFTSEMFGGKLDLKWGDVEGVETLIRMVESREGAMGRLLGEGIKTAAETIGPPARDCAVYTKKGNIPRGHDHRSLVMSHEYLDVNTSSSGTVETVGGFLDCTQHGIKPLSMEDRKDPVMLARHNAAIAGRRVMEDSLGVCRFFTERLDHLLEAMCAASGQNYTHDTFMRAGKRVMATARLYNISSGITSRCEAPSLRYGERQPDGPFAETAHLGEILSQARSEFFQFLGYDRTTGIPLPGRLEELGASSYIPAALRALEREYGAARVLEDFPAECEAYGFGPDMEVNPRRVRVEDSREPERPFQNFFDRPGLG